MILCANKVDLPQEMWRVKREEFQAFAQDHKLKVLECSASSGQNVQELFCELGRIILRTNKSQLTEIQEDQQGRNGHSLILADFADREKHKKSKKKSCCG